MAATDLKKNIARASQAPGYTVGQQIPIESIRTDGGTQARAGLDDATVAEYAETWLTLSHRQNGFLEMPPIVVFHDGSSYWLADGFHRIEAYKRFIDGPSASASPRAIRAVIQQGTQRDAILFACGANDTHGLRRTQADKRRAIERLLNDDEWRQWSDSEIGRRCNVSDKTVAAVRADRYPRNSEDSRTVERGGTTYQQKLPAQRTRELPPPADQSILPDMPAPEPESDLPAEYDIIKRRFAAHGIALLSNKQGNHRAFVTRKEGMTGIVTFDWANVLSKLERLEAQREQPTCSEVAPTAQPMDDSDDPPVGIAHAGRVLAEHGYATRLGDDDLWEVRRGGTVTKVLTRTQMITYADALTFLDDRRAVLARYDRHAMVSQVDYSTALDQIAALLE